MFYYLYRLTDQKNGKYYIGVHKTSNLDDGYMGSGSRLNGTIKKRCIKEILEFFTSEEEMFQRESEIVTESVVKDPQSYNMRCGGLGGDTLSLHPNLDEIKMKIRQAIEQRSPEEQDRINVLKGRRGESNGMWGSSRTGEANPMFGKQHNEQTRQLIGAKAKERFLTGKQVSHFKGVPLSDERKHKLSVANSRTFTFIHDGEVVNISNLAKFCRTQGLNEVCMRHVAAGRNKQHKGYYNGNAV